MAMLRNPMTLRRMPRWKMRQPTQRQADLQHEHHAEALDTLATIELKFALLRERVYVEKMKVLVWEEALVKNGTLHSRQVSRCVPMSSFFPRIRLGSHPELLHLHSELSRRRDKRIELAARRRSYEIANILKRRRAEENAVWSWWMVRFFPYKSVNMC